MLLFELSIRNDIYLCIKKNTTMTFCTVIHMKVSYLAGRMFVSFMYGFKFRSGSADPVCYIPV